MNRKLILKKIAKISFLIVRMLVLPTETVFLAGIVVLLGFGISFIKGVPVEISIAPFSKTVGYFFVAIALSALLGVVTKAVPGIWTAAKGGHRLIHKLPWKKRAKKEPEADYKYRPIEGYLVAGPERKDINE